MKRKVALALFLLATSTPTGCKSDRGSAEPRGGTDGPTDVIVDGPGGDTPEAIERAEVRPDTAAADDTRVERPSDTSPGAEPPEEDTSPPLGGSNQVLFVGNSYTFANDLPALYESLAASLDVEWSPLRTEMVALGGYTLVQHAIDTREDSAIARWLVSGSPEERAWDAVILQEQSQIPGFLETHPEREASGNGVDVLAGHAHGLGARVILFMTWGYRDGDRRNPDRFPDYPTMQERLAEGYRAMRIRAAETGADAVIAPVGLAFRIVYEDVLRDGHGPTDPTSPFGSLYAGDGSHPSLDGSYLAGVVMAAVVTGADVEALSAVPTGMSAERAAYLRGVARQALDDGPCGPCAEPTPVCDAHTGACVELE